MFNQNFYQSVSCPDKFYGPAKIHKHSTNKVDDLPLPPGTPAYQTAKYLAKLLPPFVTSKKHIMKEVLPGYEMVSLLNKTIEIILKRFSETKYITIATPKRDMKKLLYLFRKISLLIMRYLYRISVAMSSPLWPVSKNIFMIELEKTIIQSLSDKIKLWKCYTEDIVAFIKIDVLLPLNSCHGNIHFKMQIKQNHQSPFLNVILRCNLETK